MNPEPPAQSFQPPTTGFLLTRIRAGDRAALEILFARSYHHLERVVWIRQGATSQPRFDLADVLQEAFLKAWSNLDAYEQLPGHSFLDWVARIAERTLADQVRRQNAARRDPRREQSWTATAPGERIELDELIATSSTAPVDLAVERERIALLDACLGELPEAEREVLLLRHYLDCSWKEVGEQLGRTARGAEQLARRARERLHERYRRKSTERDERKGRER